MSPRGNQWDQTRRTSRGGGTCHHQRVSRRRAPLPRAPTGRFAMPPPPGDVALLWNVTWLVHVVPPGDVPLSWHVAWWGTCQHWRMFRRWGTLQRAPTTPPGNSAVGAHATVGGCPDGTIRNAATAGRRRIVVARCMVWCIWHRRMFPKKERDERAKSRGANAASDPSAREKKSND